MKTRFITISAFMAAVVTLFSCNRIETEVVVEQSKGGEPFEIIASNIDTKTVNDGVHTTWASTDQINLIHRVHDGATFVHDGAFTAKAAGASVGFTGTLASSLSSESTYDWYAFYPYVSGFSAPDGTKFITIPSTQTQSTKSSSAHLSGANCPIGGSVKDVAYDEKPVLVMSNLVSVIKVVVSNGTASNIGVSRIAFTAPVQIVGKVNLDLTGASPSLSDNSGSSTAVLEVTSPGTIAPGETGEYFISVKPFTLGGSQTLTIDVTTNKGIKSKTSTAKGSDFSFDAGEITTFNFNYNVESSVLSTVSDPVVVGFESAEGFTASSSYSNTYEKSQGTNAWGIVNGSAISTAAKITGSQSMLIRDYTANDNPAYVRTYFRLSSVKEVLFKAKNTSDGYKLKLSYSTDCGFTWTDANTFDLTSSAAEYKYTFAENVENVAFKFTMVFPATRVDKKDIIIDDVSFSKTALEPNVTVSTAAATDVASVAGTSATLNGSFDLVYGATLGNLTEVGFEYKVNAAGDYTTQAVTPTPDAVGAYSLEVTGLTANTEYTYHAYGIYNGGTKVTSADQTFTPIVATLYSMTIGGSAGANVTWSDANTTLSYGKVGETDVEWTTAVTWNSSNNYMGGIGSQVQIGKNDASGKRYSPSTISISSSAFEGKKILSATLYGFYQKNLTTNITITAGTTTMLTSTALVKGTSTPYATTADPVTLSTGQTISFNLASSDASGSVVISKIEVVYTNP